MLLSPQLKLLWFFYYKVIFKNKTSKQRINGWGFLRVPVRSQGSFPLPEGSPLLLLRASCFFISFVFSSVPGTLQICQQKAHYCHTAVLADQHNQQPTWQTPLLVSVDQMWCSISCNLPSPALPKGQILFRGNLECRISARAGFTLHSMGQPRRSHTHPDSLSAVLMHHRAPQQWEFASFCSQGSFIKIEVTRLSFYIWCLHFPLKYYFKYF